MTIHSRRVASVAQVFNLCVFGQVENLPYVAVALLAVAVCGGTVPRTASAEDFFTQDQAVEWKLINGDQARVEESVKSRAPDYRLSNLETYSDGTQLKYISVFVSNADQIPVQFAMALTQREFLERHEQHARAGLMPVDFEMAQLDGIEYFSGIWMKDPGNHLWTMRFWQTISDFDASCRSLLKDGYAPIDIEVRSEGHEPRVTTLWVRGLKRGAPRVVWDRTPEVFEKEMAEWKKEGYRPVDLETYNRDEKTNLAAIFIVDETRPEWDAAWGLKWTEWEPHARKELAKGLRPIDFTQCPGPASQCFGSIWFTPAGMTVAQASDTKSEPGSTPPVPNLPVNPPPEKIPSRNPTPEPTKNAPAEDPKAKRTARLNELVEIGKVTAEQRQLALRLLEADRDELTPADVAIREQFETLTESPR